MTGASCAYCHRPIVPGERTGKTGDFEYHADRQRCCVLLLRDVEQLQFRCRWLQEQLDKAEIKGKRKLRQKVRAHEVA